MSRKLGAIHSSMVFDHHEIIEISAELLGDDGVATEKVRHADLVSFTCLKAFALDQRYERKDAHDLVYCLEHYEGGLDAAVAVFASALEGKHSDVIKEALVILRKHFADDGKTEGFQRDGPVAVAKFELGDDAASRDDRILRQRQAAEVITSLLEGLAA